MAKFMNKELISIRDNLCCGHCSVIFSGSDSQAWKVKYEQKVVYCSKTCRAAAIKNKVSKPAPNRGACPTCKKEFFSKTAKIYCCQDCYIKSDKFKKMIVSAQLLSLKPEAKLKQAATIRKGEMVQCLECNKDIWQKPSKPRKYCNHTCYREYMAKRFDRWVANPEGLALPQCYDEFLNKEVLPCIIDGCGWSGKHLSLHANQAHGITADELKRAAGFNIGSGIIARPLAETYRARAHVGVALLDSMPASVFDSLQASGKYKRYTSLESCEHSKKSRALAGSGPTRVCDNCQIEFTQSTPFGKALYCCISCRDAAYKAARLRNKIPRIRDASGKFLPKPHILNKL